MASTPRRAARCLGVLAATLLAVSGCVSPQQQVADREDLLAAAGFRFQPATTPQRLDALHNLPPGHFARQIKGDEVLYLFADPLVCNCLYVGDQAAYGRYRQEVFQRSLADEQRLSAETFATTQWDWGAWGPFGFGPY